MNTSVVTIALENQHMDFSDNTSTNSVNEQLDDCTDQSLELQRSIEGIQGLVAREKFHHAYVRTRFYNDGATCTQIIDQECGFNRYLEVLEKFAVQLTDRNDEPTTYKSWRNGKSIPRLTRIGRKMWNVCHNYDRLVVEAYEIQEFSPRLGVMLHFLKKWAQLVVSGTTTNGRPDLSMPTAPLMLQRMFEEIRKILRSGAIRKKIKNHRRMERQNYSSCWKYMEGLFGKRSRLLILRVDLYFRRIAKGWGYTLDAHRQHEKFLRALREDRIVDDVMGSISKRENGIDRGMHFHILIAIDGHLHRDAANIARVIGERWVKQCDNEDATSEPRASYFNCYVLKDRYKFNCIGLVHVNDQLKMKGLRLAIQYLCKESYKIRAGPVAIYDELRQVIKNRGLGKRNIRKGIMPKFKKKKQGAPRKILGPCNGGMRPQQP